jgi:hypothetical protein
MEITIEGLFTDGNTANDVNFDVLPAAINLTDKFIWPIHQYSFQSVREDVSVCILSLFYINLSCFFEECEYLFQHPSK